MVRKVFDIVLTVVTEGDEEINGDSERNVERYYQLHSDYEINGTKAKVVSTLVKR